MEKGEQLHVVRLRGVTALVWESPAGGWGGRGIRGGNSALAAALTLPARARKPEMKTIRKGHSGTTQVKCNGSDLT